MTTRVRAHQINFDGKSLKDRLNELASFQAPVAGFVDLPTSAKDGEQRLVKSENVMYRYDAVAAKWVSLSVTDAQSAVWNDKYTKTETDSKVSAVQGSLDTYKTNNDSRVTNVESEISLARGGAANLDARLDGFDSKNASQDTAINNEVTRAQGEEARIEGKVNKEITDRTNAVSALQTELDGTQVDLANYKTSNDSKVGNVEANVESRGKEAGDLGVKTGGLVKAQAIASMNVDVEGTTVYNDAGKRFVVAAGSLPIGAADATNPRKDIVFVDGNGVLKVAQGTAALTPVAPSVPANSILLAEIDVPAGDTAIDSVQIIDKRTFKTGATDINVQTKNITVAGNILPTTNRLQDIGSSTNRFRALYVDEAYLSTNTLYIGNTAILGTEMDTIQIKADLDQSINMATSGIGITYVSSVNGVQMSTSGMNADVKIQGTGTGSRVLMSAQNEVNMSATNIKMSGAVDIVGATALDSLTVRGNLTVNGTTTTVSSATLEVADNTILVNKGETGAGVTKGSAGIQVDRGSAADYFMVFDETDDMFKVGTSTALETIASHPFVQGKVDTVQTDLNTYKTNNDGRVTNIETVNTNQGNRITSVEGEISTARNGATSLDVRLDGMDSTIAGKAASIHSHAIGDVTNLQATLDGKLSVNGGTVNGAIAVGNGADIALRAGSTNTADSGDLVFENNAGAELARLWQSGGQLLTRFGATDTAKAVFHAGNFDPASKLDATANAVSASKLATGRTIALGGDVSGSVVFDGSANVTISAVVADNSHAHSIANITNLQTELDKKQDDIIIASVAPTAPVANMIWIDTAI